MRAISTEILRLRAYYLLTSWKKIPILRGNSETRDHKRKFANFSSVRCNLVVHWKLFLPGRPPFGALHGMVEKSANFLFVTNSIAA